MYQGTGYRVDRPTRRAATRAAPAHSTSSTSTSSTRAPAAPAAKQQQHKQQSISTSSKKHQHQQHQPPFALNAHKAADNPRTAPHHPELNRVVGKGSHHSDAAQGLYVDSSSCASYTVRVRVLEDAAEGVTSGGRMGGVEGGGRAAGVVGGGGVSDGGGGVGGIESDSDDERCSHVGVLFLPPLTPTRWVAKLGFPLQHSLVCL
jgi:hypothetical protein